jgi:hypothetical protein
MPFASPSFEEFCNFLEKLSSIKSSEKKKTLENFINKWVRGFGPDVYDAIRLLFPKVSF